MKTPDFWYKKKSFLSRLLKPIGKIYGWTVARRFKKTKPYQTDIPVICVGNLSVGGTGKTPVCLALGKILQEKGIRFFFLNHGYKAQKKGVIVDTHQMTSVDVGDEALLMAENAPTVVDNHRARGAQIALRHKAEAIIMDDGFQNPSLIKTLSFVVVDGKTGFGNGEMIPAGPLREPVEKGLLRADAVIIVGEDKTNIYQDIQKIDNELPIFMGHFEPDKRTISSLVGKNIIAFAGIGQPNKFFDMLTEKGINIVKKVSFPDHYSYTRFDIEQLMNDAGGLPLVTTTKDFVKVPVDMRSGVRVISGEFIFDKPEEIENLIQGIL